MTRRAWDLWLTFLDKVNFTIPALTTYFILYTRCAGVVYFTVGAVFCSASCKVVKRIIRQPRPPNLPGRKLKASYGMPSTHSSTISYYAAYICLGCLYLPIHPTFPPGLSTRILPPLIALPFAIMVVMSRLWLGHHTMPQVVAGTLYGVTYATVWFALWVNGLNKWGVYAEQIFDHWINATLVDGGVYAN